jgi:hypothetical protein
MQQFTTFNEFCVELLFLYKVVESLKTSKIFQSFFSVPVSVYCKNQYCGFGSGSGLDPDSGEAFSPQKRTSSTSKDDIY